MFKLHRLRISIFIASLIFAFSLFAVQPVQAELGKDWELANGFSPRANHANVVFDEKMWVIGGWDGKDRNDVWYSDNGVDWNRKINHAEFPSRMGHTCTVFDGRMWVIGGRDLQNNKLNDIWYSTNGSHWISAATNAPFEPRTNHSVLVFQNKLWLLGGVGIGGEQNLYDNWYSSDGIVWNRAPDWIDTNNLNHQLNFSHVVFDNKIWAIGGSNENSEVWCTSNGTTWTQVTDHANFTPRRLHKIISFDNKIWILGGFTQSGELDIWSSSNGNNWTISAPMPTELKSHLRVDGFGVVEFQDSLWLLGGKHQINHSNVWRTDGDAWEFMTNQNSFSPRASLSSVVYDNKIWIIGGGAINSQNDIWNTANGIDWNPVTLHAEFSPRKGHASIVFDNKMWVIGGNDGIKRNDVWYSSDGIQWNLATNNAAFSPRQGHQSVVFNDKIWVIGGDSLNDIWCSGNGIEWQLATESAAFSPRTDHACTVFQEKIWLIGGTGSEIKNDIWYSTNGIEWQQVTEHAPFTPRSGHQCIAMNNKLWVIDNECWSSSDGTNWILATNSISFAGCRSSSVVTFQNRIWRLGGRYFSSYFNDVWYTELAPPDNHPTPAALDFGHLQLGMQSSPQSIAIENIGELPLEITDVYLSGDDADEFVLLPPDDKSLLTLAPGESTDYRVTFAPTTFLGEVPFHERAAQLVIESNDPDTPALAVPLTGRSEKDPAPEGISAIEDWMALE